MLPAPNDISDICQVSFALLSAGSLLDKPWSVVFMHIASRKNPETSFGLGVSMHHPLCGYMYIKKVLPM